MKITLLIPSIVLAASAFAFAGHEIDDKKAIAEPELFRAHETQIDTFASFGVGDIDFNDQQVTRTRTHTVTRLVPETFTTTQLVPVPVVQPPLALIALPVAAPAAFTSVTRTSTVLTPVKHTVSERVTRTQRDFTHNAFGGGVGVNYFLTRNLGLGLEGDWLAGDSAVNEAAASVIYRFPWENSSHSFGAAPYVFLGGGGQFDGVNAGFGHAGGGVELRFQRNFGIFSDGRYIYHDDDINYGLFRLGARLVF